LVFSSLIFLCVFLPVVFLLYYIIPSMRAKNILLIVFSFLFYAYGEPVYVLLMLFSTFLNYLFGRLIGSGYEARRKAVLITAVCVNLALLGVFKYTDMIIGTVNAMLGTSIALTGIQLPIGISFFTFQAMSYVIDVYRREVKAQKSYLNIMLYISFFPQLIAGPIVKYHDIENQINFRQHNPKEIAEGLRRFILGLAKKVLIANTVAIAADTLFAVPMAEINMSSAWIAALAYMIQIYFDFSGYSDMAIGLGHMFGFTFLENFRYPYSALNIKDFWRRWHISLSTWFKEYLYIPLGGNRKGKARTCLNKIIVFFATGLWHGANWTFVVWGLFHGLFLLLEEVVRIRKLPKILGHAYTLLIVCLGFVIFRADTLQQGMQMIGQMFTGVDFSLDKVGVALEQLTPGFIAAMLLGWIIAFPVLPRMKEKLAVKSSAKRWAVPATYIFSIILLVVCMLNLSSGTYNPFIYFRF